MRLTHKQQWACAEWVFSIKTTKQQWLSRWWVCGDSLNTVADINNTINIIHPTVQVFWVHARNDGELWDKPFKGRKKGKLLQLFGMSGGSDMPTDYHRGVRKELPRITEKQESLERQQDNMLCCYLLNKTQTNRRKCVRTSTPHHSVTYRISLLLCSDAASQTQTERGGFLPTRAGHIILFTVI